MSPLFLSHCGIPEVAKMNGCVGEDLLFRGHPVKDVWVQTALDVTAPVRSVCGHVTQKISELLHGWRKGQAQADMGLLLSAKPLRALCLIPEVLRLQECDCLLVWAYNPTDK